MKSIVGRLVKTGHSDIAREFVRAASSLAEDADFNKFQKERDQLIRKGNQETKKLGKDVEDFISSWKSRASKMFRDDPKKQDFFMKVVRNTMSELKEIAEVMPSMFDLDSYGW